MVRKPLLALSGLFVALLSGCGTLQNTVFALREQEANKVYGGVQVDVDAIRTWVTSPPSCGTPPFIALPLVVADLPFSAVGDTLTLPVTVPWSLRRAGLVVDPKAAGGTP